MKRNSTPQCPDVPLVNGKAQVDALKCLQTEIAAELDALLPSILDKAVKGEL